MEFSEGVKNDTMRLKDIIDIEEDDIEMEQLQEDFEEMDEEAVKEIKDNKEAQLKAQFFDTIDEIVSKLREDITLSEEYKRNAKNMSPGQFSEPATDIPTPYSRNVWILLAVSGIVLLGGLLVAFKFKRP